MIFTTQHVISAESGFGETFFFSKPAFLGWRYGIGKTTKLAAL